MRVAVVATAIWFSIIGLARADDAKATIRKPTDIPAQQLGRALASLANEFDFQVLYRTEVVGALTTRGVSGSMTAAEALEHVLTGTGLTYRYLDEKTVTIIPTPTGPTSEAQNTTTNVSGQESTGGGHDKEGGQNSSSTQRTSNTPPDDVAGHKPDELQEVIVTARFRSESLQHIGAAISSVNSEAIEHGGITDFEDIVRRTPGLASTYRGPNTNEVLLRGIANQTGELVTDVSSVSPLVGQFLDDVPFASATASQRDLNLFDFARVEILRGPQPTLFGEGSVGGTIRYISADPDLSVGPVGDAIVRSGASSIKDGGANSWADAAATVNLVPDVFGVRAVLNWRRDGGFIDDPLRHAQNINTFRSGGGRIVALLRPSDALSVRFAAHFSRDKTGDLPNIDVGSDPVRRVLSTPFGGSTTDDIDLYSLKADYVAGPITVTSITGYYRRKRETSGYDGSNSGFFTALLHAPINFVAENSPNDATWSQEFRLVSGFQGPLNFIGGLFYKDKTSEVVAGLTSPDGSFAPYQAVPGGPIFHSSPIYKTTQYSGFLEGTLALTHHIRFIAGARYVHEHTDSTVNQFLSVGGVTPPIATIDFAAFLGASGLPTTFPFDLNKLLPRAAIEIDLSRNALLYASAATGVRNGGLTAAVSAFQAAGGGTPSFDSKKFADLLVFKEDKVLTYELGLKSRSLGGRLTANVAAYFTQYDHPQITTYTPFVFVTNGPNAEIKGLELGTDFQASHFLTLFANASYTDARFVHSALLDPALAPVIGADVVRGNRLANVPEWAFAAGADVTHRLGNIKLVGHLDYDYVGDRYSSPQNFVSSRLPPMGLVNARLGFETDHWSVVGFVTNATNEIRPLALATTGVQAFVNASGRLDAPVNQVSINRPRTLGVELTRRF
jgi:iron complex outermembrane recepter protein